MAAMMEKADEIDILIVHTSSHYFNRPIMCERSVQQAREIFEAALNFANEKSKYVILNTIYAESQSSITSLNLGAEQFSNELNNIFIDATK